jgi:hypothetical protein
VQRASGSWPCERPAANRPGFLRNQLRAEDGGVFGENREVDFLMQNSRVRRGLRAAALGKNRGLWSSRRTGGIEYCEFEVCWGAIFELGMLGRLNRASGFLRIQLRAAGNARAG